MASPTVVKALGARATPLPSGQPVGPYSPLIAEMHEVFSAQAMGAALPREVGEFQGTFAPFNPIAPVPIDRPSPTGRPEPRRSQYQVGYNLPTPPGAEKLVDWDTLKNIAGLHDVSRRCIALRKSEFSLLEWEITARSRSKQEERDLNQKYADEIDRITKFMAYPDPINGRHFVSWIKVLIEEHLVTDTMNVYVHPTWGAAAGLSVAERVAALKILDGSTIKPLRDIRGDRPLPPNPAYQQFLYGFPRSEFTGLKDEDQIVGGSGTAADPAVLRRSGVKTRFATDQLIYKPFEERSWTMYGFPPTEQIILAINLALRREDWHAKYFTESNLPAGFLRAPEGWNTAQIQEYQSAFDALLAGDPAWRHKIKVVATAAGGGSFFEQMKPPVHEMDLDDFLIRMICLGYDVMPEQIGFPPKNGLGGAGWAEGSAAASRRKSTRPLAKFLKDEILDPIIATQFGMPELQWRWLALENDDALEQEEIDKSQLSTGRLTINQWLITHDKDPLPADIKEGDEPMIITGKGITFLKGQLAVQQDQADMAKESHQAGLEAQKEQAASGGPAAGSARNRPAARKAAELEDDDELDPAAVLEDLGRWQRKALKAVREGRPAAVRFDSELVDDGVRDAVAAALAKAVSADDVRGVFAAAKREVNQHPDWLTAAGGALERSLQELVRDITDRHLDELARVEAGG